MLILLSWLQYSLWFGKNGIFDLVKIQKDLNIQENKNTELKIRNNHLLAEINDLNLGQEAIEERSRNELGMIKHGEIFYRLISDKSKK